MSPEGERAGALREQLAALCHEQWSGWMRHLFSKCVERPRDTGGTLLAVPEWAVERWRRVLRSLPGKVVDKNVDKKLHPRYTPHRGGPFGGSPPGDFHPWVIWFP